MSKKSLWIIIVFLLLIIFTGLIYLGGKYFLDSYQNEAAQTQQEGKADQGEEEVGQELSPTQIPQDVVDEFMTSSLGTLPRADLDEEKARSHMTNRLKSLYSGEGWIPQFYGIQAGPDSYTKLSTNIVDDVATVKINVTFGESSLVWAFLLKKVDNVWKIDEFRNDI
jgi:hypothetical protein